MKKKVKALFVVAACLLTLGIVLVNGCGGGSSGGSTAASPSPSPSASSLWTIESGVRLANTTSSCTLKLQDNSYRMYINNARYSTSTDGLTWATPQSLTGITHQVWNPAVIFLNNKYIMIYEVQTTENNAMVRRLFRAESSDGLSFTETPGSFTNGAVLEPASDEHNFLSVPDLIALDANTIRMYYVAGGMAVKSATSTDGGMTWTGEGFIAISGLGSGIPFVDPDIIRLPDNSYRLFFTANPDNQAVNQLINMRIRSAVSTDGRNFTLESGNILTPPDSTTVYVDADVIALTDGRYRLYFGDDGGTGTGYNLKSAISP